MLIVCSSQRRDSCPAARAFSARTRLLAVRAEVLPIAKTHGAINAELGAAGEYTEAVERFLASLDPVLARALRG
jgi:hypothetical protein